MSGSNRAVARVRRTTVPLMDCKASLLSWEGGTLRRNVASGHAQGGWHHRENQPADKG